MASTPSVSVTKGSTLLVARAGPDIRVVLGSTLALINYPTEEVRATFASIQPVIRQNCTMEATLATTMAVVLGRVSDPRVRVWTFELDQHDYYIIRLGNEETLIYDVFSDQWYVWGSGDTEIWRAYTGINWLAAGANAQMYGSNIVVGDDSNGTLWFLDPSADDDEDAVEGPERQRPFLRKATSQIAVRGYSSVPCYGIELLGSSGESSISGVTLFTSDDRGDSFTDRGTIDVSVGDYDTRLNWRSLGSMRNLGRIFRIEDRGALKRIDSLTLEGDEE